MKTLIGGIVFLGLVGAIAYYVLHVPQQTIMVAPDLPQGAGEEKEVQTYEVSVNWDFRLIEDGVSDVMNPQTDVGVSFELTDEKGNKTEKGPYRIGAYTGSCSEQGASGQEREIAHALCWFAGAGVELSAVREEKAVYVLHRYVDEGAPETPAPAEAFVSVLEVQIP